MVLLSGAAIADASLEARVELLDFWLLASSHRLLHLGGQVDFVQCYHVSTRQRARHLWVHVGWRVGPQPGKHRKFVSVRARPAGKQHAGGSSPAAARVKMSRRQVQSRVSPHTSYPTVGIPFPTRMKRKKTNK